MRVKLVAIDSSEIADMQRVQQRTGRRRQRRQPEKSAKRLVKATKNYDDNDGIVPKRLMRSGANTNSDFINPSIGSGADRIAEPAPTATMAVAARPEVSLTFDDDELWCRGSCCAAAAFRFFLRRRLIQQQNPRQYKTSDLNDKRILLQTSLQSLLTAISHTARSERQRQR